MLGIAIRFDLGRYHANPWGAHVNDAATEWPPSPWRLIRALYATARTNTRLADQRAEIDRGLTALMAAPPPVFELPPAIPAHTRHYMPQARYSALESGATDKVFDGFLAIDPSAEVRAWWDASIDGDALEGLAAAVRSLGYLGRSESVCSARLIDNGGPEEVAAAPAEADAVTRETGELVELLCPEPTQPLEAVATSIDALRRQRRRLPPGARHVRYAVARPDGTHAPPASVSSDVLPKLAVLRLAGAQRPGIHEAVAAGQALRAALQSRFGKTNGGGASKTFSGREGDAPRRDQHAHAHYLSWPDPHGRRVDRLVVWAPEGLESEEVTALATLGHVKMHEIGALQVALAALGDPGSIALPELLGPATTWESLTPFGLVRHPKQRGGRLVDSPEDQVRRELEHRGLPAPDEVSLEKKSWHRFRSSKVGMSRLARANLFGVRLGFSKPVSGPIALGALSHYGLGVMRAED